MVDQRGWRGKIGVAVPATNTMVQPDFDDLRPDGVTNHVSRIAVPNMAIENDADFDRLIRICESELDGAVDRVMSVAPDILVIGISSLLVWDGQAASERRRDRAVAAHRPAGHRRLVRHRRGVAPRRSNTGRGDLALSANRQ